MTSAAPSRAPSRPRTRTTSRESEPDVEDDIEDDIEAVPPEHYIPINTTPIIPADPPLAHTKPLDPPLRLRRRKFSTAGRTLSNLEDGHFGSHRDSVALAHARLTHASNFSEILETHRESVELAKRKMRDRRMKWSQSESGYGGRKGRRSEGSEGSGGSERSAGGKHVQIVE
jgi:hypothetical protein